MMFANPAVNDLNRTRMRYDLKASDATVFESHWENRTRISHELFEKRPRVFFEVGAGTGWFFFELAKHHADVHFVAIERCKTRGKRLLHRAERTGLPNISAFRGNAIPALIHGIPDESIERLYILYPCPFTRTSQRRNRWYLHPVMRHLLRILKKDGLMIWASDQKFYIDEAHFACTEFFGMKSLEYGELKPNPYNDLALFPSGRTKFECDFLEKGQPCYELVVQKPQGIR